MKERNMRIAFSSGFDRVTEHNASFDKGVLRVCYVGRNRNNSFISKETFERCMQSIYNCPIVCRYDRDADEIGAHDMEVVKDDAGQVSLVNITAPVGLVPESAAYWWEEVEEADGAIHEYLCVEALLWKRQEAYQKIRENGITSESMEICVKEGSMQNGVYVIDRFEFTAFCLLGTAEPCYESASLMLFSRENFKAQLDEMMREFKTGISSRQPGQEGGVCKQGYPEGGNKTLDEKKALMTKYGLDEEKLGFQLEDFSLEELQEKLEALTADATPATDDNENFALAGAFREELIGALGAEKVETCFGEVERYWYMDYDSEAAEVYCYDCEDWKLYGFTYSMNGDHVVIDFESRKRKKFAVVDFDEGEQSAVFEAAFSKMSAAYTENDSRWAEKYQSASEKINSMEAELEGLRQFKADAENKAAMHAREDVLSDFEKELSGIDAFETLRETCQQYSVEELEEKCFAIKGKNLSGKFSLQGQKPPRLPVEKGAKGKEPYGGIFAEYGIVRE